MDVASDPYSPPAKGHDDEILLVFLARMGEHGDEDLAHHFQQPIADVHIQTWQPPRSVL